MSKRRKVQRAGRRLKMTEWEMGKRKKERAKVRVEDDGMGTGKHAGGFGGHHVGLLGV